MMAFSGGRSPGVDADCFCRKIAANTTAKTPIRGRDGRDGSGPWEEFPAADRLQRVLAAKLFTPACSVIRRAVARTSSASGQTMNIAAPLPVT